MRLICSHSTGSWRGIVRLWQYYFHRWACRHIIILLPTQSHFDDLQLYINSCSFHVAPLPRPTTISHPSPNSLRMDSTVPQQSYVSLFEGAPARHTGSSIWAPQPQPSDTTWSKAIDSITRAEGSLTIDTSLTDVRRSAPRSPGRGGEDVFGPVGLVGHPCKKDVGAIGDGRKKNASDFDAVVSHIFILYAH